MEATLEDLIAIDLIAVEILKKLERKDLLNCALLNKQWNELTRDYLYRTESLSIELVLVENRESNLDRLNWLQNSGQKIFKQLNLSIFSCYSQHECDQDFWPLLFQLRQAPIIAPGITSVEVNDNCTHNDKCEAMDFLKSVLQNFPENSIKNLNAKYVKDFQSIFVKNDQFIFPQLQTINLNPNENLDKLCLIPSLKEFTGEIFTWQLGTILEQEKAHLIKYLNLDSLPHSEGSEMDILLRFAEQQPQLKGLTISDTQVRDLILNRNKGLKMFFQSILNSSFHCLEKIYCKIDLQVLSTISQICDKSFPGVKSFIFPQQQLFEAEILGSISLSKLFPNLSTVIVSHVKHFKIDRDVLEDIREFSGNMVCNSVKNLVFSQFKYQYRFRSEYNEIFAEIFPNVRNLKYEFVNNESELVSICSSLWPGIWKQLENLSMSLIPDQLSKCEWCFLGISKQEWKYWVELKKNGVNLTTMLFVPCDFSWADLKGTEIWLKIKSSACSNYPTELLELIEVEPNLFRLSTRVGLAVEPDNMSSSDTIEPLTATRLIRGIHNQLSRFKNRVTSFTTSFNI